MKITASLVAKKEWSTSCTRDSEEDFEGAFSDCNFDLTIANVIADLLYMSKYQIANLEYTIACIVSDVLDHYRQNPDEEQQAWSCKLYLAANELIAYIEARHEARQQQ